MLGLFIWLLYSGVAIYVIYGFVDHKMHIKPWRLIALGFVLLALIFFAQIFGERYLKLINESDSAILKNGIALVVTMITAMAGALFGTAISNRTSRAYDNKMKEVLNGMAIAEDLYKKPADEIHAILCDKTHPLTAKEIRENASFRTELLYHYAMSTAELREELEKLKP